MALVGKQFPNITVDAITEMLIKKMPSVNLNDTFKK